MDLHSTFIDEPVQGLLFGSKGSVGVLIFKKITKANF